VAFLGIGLLCTALSKNAFAHCDTLDGPVVQTARIAFEKGDVTPLLKWVQADDEKEIRVAFQKTLAVRSMGAKAKELADMYFITDIYLLGSRISKWMQEPLTCRILQMGVVWRNL
jgi:hypothetical protein